LQIDAVTDEAVLAGREVVDAGVAGVGAELQHGDGALQQVLAGGVGEACAVEGVFGEDGVVVDREPFGFDFVGDERVRMSLICSDLKRSSVLLSPLTLPACSKKPTPLLKSTTRATGTPAGDCRAFAWGSLGIGPP
jgi:hypothetical protein